MKTIATIFFSIIALVSTANANNIEIINTTLASTPSLTNGTTENTVTLNWVAKNETGNSHYEIERSFYSNNFTTIATLDISFSNNSSLKNYRVNDNAAALNGREIAYYRIKQTAATGIVSYSNVMIVNLHTTTLDTTAGVKNTSIRFTATQNGNAVITVKSLTGQTVATNNTLVVKGNNTVELANMTTVAKGIYVVETSVNGVLVDTQKVIAE